MPAMRRPGVQRHAGMDDRQKRLSFLNRYFAFVKEGAAALSVKKAAAKKAPK